VDKENKKTLVADEKKGTKKLRPEEADRGQNLSAQLLLAEPSNFLLALGSHVSGSRRVASECPGKEW
jgi:hypothetical protein